LKSVLRLLPNKKIRYEIEEGAPGWADAERQVLNATKDGQKNPVVSVKTSKKRKPGETAAQIYEEEVGEKIHKKAKKASKKEKHRS
jgi:N-acetyltransferase 10